MDGSEPSASASAPCGGFQAIEMCSGRRQRLETGGTPICQADLFVQSRRIHDKRAAARSREVRRRGRVENVIRTKCIRRRQSSSGPPIQRTEAEAAREQRQHLDYPSSGGQRQQSPNQGAERLASESGASAQRTASSSRAEGAGELENISHRPAAAHLQARTDDSQSRATKRDRPDPISDQRRQLVRIDPGRSCQHQCLLRQQRQLVRRHAKCGKPGPSTRRPIGQHLARSNAAVWLSLLPQAHLVASLAALIKRCIAVCRRQTENGQVIDVERPTDPVNAQVIAKADHFGAPQKRNTLRDETQMEMLGDQHGMGPAHWQGPSSGHTQPACGKRSECPTLSGETGGSPK